MGATGIMRILENDPPRLVCCLGMVVSIRLEQQGPTDSYSASTNELQPTSHNVLVQGIHCCLEILYIAINHLASAVLPNIVETEHCTFFREHTVVFEPSFFTVGMQRIIFDNQ
jgi:hypothetical protein